jgi:hypothetical protein
MVRILTFRITDDRGNYLKFANVIPGNFPSFSSYKDDISGVIVFDSFHPKIGFVHHFPCTCQPAIYLD